MNRLTKILLCIALSLMCFLSNLGYAQLSSNITVEGNVEAEPPNAVFITEISNVQTSGVTLNADTANIGYPSTMVMNDLVFSRRNSYISFDVEIMNGTDINHYFNILSELSSHEGIGDSFSYLYINEKVSISQGTLLSPGMKTTFTVTLTYTGSASNQTRKMLHKFDFVLDSNDLTQAASNDVTDRFSDILNNNITEEIKYDYNGSPVTIPSDQIFAVLKQNMENSGSGNFIGNLDGADADDKALVNALLGDTLVFNVGDQEVPVTVMIKENDVYGSSEKEMILYITADDLTATTKYVPVYAAIFTNTANGWIQVGDILAGEAQTCYYNFGYFGNGSFNTDTWRSTQQYYGVATRNSLVNVMNGYEAQNP